MKLTPKQRKSLKAENLFLWQKISEMEQKQLKYLINLTEPVEKTIGNFFQKKL